MSAQRRLLQIPPGTEGFFLEEAYRHRRILSELDTLITRWGYLPAETPVFDFYDIYQPLLDESSTETIYRMMDRDGDLLMLRNDVTLFLAKQMGMALTEEDLPVRVWYADSILRHQQQEDISKNEFYQLGAELIGVPGIAGDAEILVMAAEILKLLELPAALHIGSSALIHLAAEGLSPREAKSFFKAVALRDREAMEELIAGRSDRSKLLELLTFIGTPQEFHASVSGLGEGLAEEFQASLRELDEIARLLMEQSPEIDLRIDLSETGSQAYHTGMVFQAYLEGIDSAFLSGGRYDNLLATFGFTSPSVGFSLLLRKIEPLVGRPERFAPPKEGEKAEGSSFAERYRDAAAKRAAGRIIRL